MASMKKIKIEYEELNNTVNELMVLSVCCDAPEFKNKRKIYLYELASIESINLKFMNYLSSDAYLLSTDYLAPIYLNLSNKEFKELSEYLSEDTVYEEVIWNEKCAELNRKIYKLKNDPKFWEVE